MQESFEELLIYLRGVWKYRWFSLILAFGLIIMGWFFISQSPIIYTANAKIYVNTSTVLKPLLKGLAIEKDPSAYLGLITREIVSRPILEQVANKVHLFGPDIVLQKKELFLSGMENSIRVDVSSANEASSPQDFYVISYASQDPKIAKEVVKTLISTFVDKTVAASEQDSEVATSFLDQQIKEMQDALIIAEAEIAKFKSNNVNKLPQGGVSYFQRLQSAQAAYDEVTLKITEIENQRQELRRQLDSTPSSQRALSVDGGVALSASAARLAELKLQLQELLLKYTEKHPDVLAIRRSIIELEKQTPIDNDSVPVAPNPVYQQIQLALGQVESEIAALQVRKTEYLERVKKLQNQTASLTDVEAKLQRLNENYEQAKQKYDALVARRGSAIMAENVEQAGENVRFRVIDPPRITDSEQLLVHKRLAMTSGILVVGVGGGFVLALLLSQLWPVVYTRRGQQELYGIPVLGAILKASKASEKKRQYADLGGFALVCLLIVAVHGAAVWQHIGSIRHALQTAGSIG